MRFDWLRAVIFQLNLKYLHVKITNLLWVVIFNNYSPKAKLILLNNPQDEVEGIIQQYYLSLRLVYTHEVISTESERKL